jgi:DNA-binding response OmpR family regulator
MRDILIVEDGLHERERLNKLLSGAQYSVLCAESAEEAERLLEIEKFRLAILDVGLGDKSGSYLFERVKKTSAASFVVILTGNPSAHLKQRFLDEGAAAYIVKASPMANNESLLQLVQSLLGDAKIDLRSGIPLTEFLRDYVDDTSKELFLETSDELPPCRACGNTDFIVTFNHKTQMPPLVEGRVICNACFAEMDPDVE